MGEKAGREEMDRSLALHQAKRDQYRDLVRELRDRLQTAERKFDEHRRAAHRAFSQLASLGGEEE